MAPSGRIPSSSLAACPALSWAQVLRTSDDLAEAVRGRRWRGALGHVREELAARVRAARATPGVR